MSETVQGAQSAQLPNTPAGAGVVYPAKMLEDLKKSGLEPNDMRARPLGEAEKANCTIPMGADGYVIPYFSPNGAPIAFYRARVYGQEYKYKQAANTQAHLYFPLGLAALLRNAPKYILWVEGEKKATACVKAGIPAIGVGGVDNWRNRTLVLPKDMKLAHTKTGNIAARVPPGAMVGETIDAVAVGYNEVVDLLKRSSLPLVIVYDRDKPEGCREEVQRAAASLAYDLRFRGIGTTQIRQLILPWSGSGLSGSTGNGSRDPGATNGSGSNRRPNGSGGSLGKATGGDKTAVDDYLVQFGPQALKDLVAQNLAQRSAFPRHPNTRHYVNKKLQRSHLTREELQQISMAILSDLDAKGSRLKSIHDGQAYYFDYTTRKLLKATFDMKQPFYETQFGIYLYNNYNLSMADARILTWLGAQFNAEEPLQMASPEKVMCIRKDTCYIQLNDGQTIRVNAEGIDIINNGDDEVLFESGMVTNSSEETFKDHLAIQFKKEEEQKGLANQWYHVLQDARFAEAEGDVHRKITSYLWYISPWLYKWRGTQLPVEVTVGEPGSGKSTLYQLKLDIITGTPNLKNAPNDMRDWVASVAGTGGLHVTDNVQLLDQNLRQKLSDEICRLITAPDPAFEQRKLYTDNTIIKTPVKVVFAITAVRQPFTNVDIIQRAIITELDKGTDASMVYNDTWEEQKLTQFGGREGWLAHHALFLHRFFQKVENGWDYRYKGTYRLTNIEQSLQIVARLFGDDPAWIAPFLSKDRDRRMQESDWALEGIKGFLEDSRVGLGDKIYQQYFYASDIVEWAKDEDDFKACQILQNSRSLGRYLATHKQILASTIGFVPTGQYGNRERYQVRNPNPSRGR